MAPNLSASLHFPSFFIDYILRRQLHSIRWYPELRSSWICTFFVICTHMHNLYAVICINRCLKYSFGDRKIQNRQLGLHSKWNIVQTKWLSYSILSDAVCFQEEWKGCFCWWKVAPLMGLVWRGCMKSFFALFPLSSWWPWGFLSACLILKEILEVQIGELWQVAGFHNSTRGHLCLLSLWNCMGLQRRLCYRVGRTLWICAWCYIRYSESPQIAHLSQHSWVELLCFPSKHWRNKKIIRFNAIS